MKKFFAICSLLFVFAACTKAVDMADGSGGGGNGGTPLGNNQAALGPVFCNITSSPALYEWMGSSNTQFSFDYECFHSAGKALTGIEYSFVEGVWVAGSGGPAASTLSGTQSITISQSGTYTFRVRARDAEGNTGVTMPITWKSDLENPTISELKFLASPAGAPKFTFVTNDPGANASGLFDVLCKASRTFTDWQSCDSFMAHNFPTMSASTTPDTFFVKVMDYAGNSAEATVAFTVSSAAPAGACTIADVADYTSLKTFNIGFSCSPLAQYARYECRLDNATSWADCTPAAGQSGNYLVNNLADGQHRFEMRAYATGADSATLAQPEVFNVDTTPPSIFLVEQGTYSALPYVTYAGFDRGGSGIKGYKYKFEGPGLTGSWSPLTTNETFSHAVQAGQDYKLTVVAYDNMGLESPQPLVVTWTSNPGTGPACVITKNFPSDFSRNNSENISFTCASPAKITSFEHSLNGADWSTFKPGSSAALGTYVGLSGLTHGRSYALRIRAKDEFGNEGAASNEVNWTVDNEAPSLSLSLINRNPEVKLLFTAEDPVSGLDYFECALDGVETWYPCLGGEKVYGGLTLNQSYTARVRVFDRAGNKGQNYLAFNSTVPPVGPECRFVNLAPTTWTAAKNRHYEFDCGPAEKLADILCSKNGENFFSCKSGTYDWTDIGSGSFDFYVKGLGRNNIAGDPIHDAFKVDNTAPTVTSVQVQYQANNVARISFDASDVGGSEIASIRCQVDGFFEWKDCSGKTVEVTGAVAPGASYTFRVEVKDSAGNSSLDNPTSLKTHLWTNGNWGAWSSCSAQYCDTAGVKTRQCNSPTPLGGGLACAGPNTEACMKDNCRAATNRGWSATCSTTCGNGGVKTCAQPRTAFTNSDCVTGQTLQCNLRACKCWDQRPTPEYVIGAKKTLTANFSCGVSSDMPNYVHTALGTKLLVEGTDFFTCKGISLSNNNNVITLSCSNSDSAKSRSGSPYIKCCTYK